MCKHFFTALFCVYFLYKSFRKFSREGCRASTPILIPTTP